MNRLGQAAKSPRRHAGISPALRIDDGLSMLQVGADDGSLSEAIASAGAELLVLEADPAAARAVGTRLVDHESARVIGSTFADWVGAAGDAPARLDAIIFQAPPPGDGAVTATLDEVLGRTDQLLRGSGALVVVTDNPGALARLLRGASANGGYTPPALANALREVGLDQQRWLLPYPDHHRPRVIVDASLFDDPGRRAIIRIAVRDPVPLADGEPYLVPPLEAFGAALDAGLAPAVANSLVVVAARDQRALDDRTRVGSMWTVPDPGLVPSWQRPRELIEVSGRWMWHPVDSYQVRTSGPLVLGAATVPATAGQSAEDLIVQALTMEGAFTDTSRELLATWWRAVDTTLGTSDPECRPLDLRPRQFVVTADGTWHYQAGDLGMRFALPREVLAFAALADTIVDSVLAHGWPVGLPPESTIAGAAMALLRDIGADCDDATEYLWVETAADIMVRTQPATERDEARRSVEARLHVRLDSQMQSMPLSSQLRAGMRSADASARLKVLEAQLHESRSEVQALRAEIAGTLSEYGSASPVRQPAHHIPDGEYVPLFDTDVDYLAVVQQLEPWQAALDEVVRREAIAPAGVIEVMTPRSFATFRLSSEHVAKIYLKRFEGFGHYDQEIRALRMLERDASLGAPRLVGNGRLGDRGRYVVTTRVRGRDVEAVRTSLAASDLAQLAAWSGRWLRRLHMLPLEPVERREAWVAFSDVIGHLRRTAAGELAARSALPAHLAQQVEAWLPTAEEMLGAEEELVLLHGALDSRHVMVDIDDEGIHPIGVIDFDSSRIAPAMWDLASAWSDLASAPDGVIDAFMGEADFPGFGRSDFPRRALAWAIVQRWDRAYAMPDIDELASLDELAERIYGRANAFVPLPHATVADPAR